MAHMGNGTLDNGTNQHQNTKISQAASRQPFSLFQCCSWEEALQCGATVFEQSVDVINN